MKNFVARLFAALLLSALPLNAATAQEAQSGAAADLPSPYDVKWNAFKANNPLSGLQQLQRREAEYLASPTLREAYLDGAMIQLCNAVGEYPASYRYEEQLLAAWEPRTKSRAQKAKDIETSPLENYKPQSAAAAIAAAADKHQIIILNEEHRASVHRALLLRLLPQLRAKGFRYFAAETLEEDADLNKRGYPTVNSGFYTNDPVFGDAVRTALKLGFKLIPYERTEKCERKPDQSPVFCDDQRERAQARNIYERVLKNDPNAKIFIFVGRGHGAKGKLSDEYSFMGHYLWNLSRIEPFTIDQLEFSEFYNRADENPLYRFVTSRYALAEPTIFVAPDNEFYSANRVAYDAQIFTPRAEYRNNRPTWLEFGGLRAAHKLKLKDLNLQADKNRFRAAAPVLVQAFAANENADAVPVDQIVLRPRQAVWNLMLPAGDFRIRAVDETGKTLGQYQFRRK